MLLLNWINTPFRKVNHKSKQEMCNWREKNLLKREFSQTIIQYLEKILNLIWMKPLEQGSCVCFFMTCISYNFSPQSKLSIMLSKLCLIGILFLHFAQNETQNQSTVDICKIDSVALQCKCWNLIIFDTF